MAVAADTLASDLARRRRPGQRVLQDSSTASGSNRILDWGLCAGRRRAMHYYHYGLTMYVGICGLVGRTTTFIGGDVGSIPAILDARNVHSFHRWQFEIKLSTFL